MAGRPRLCSCLALPNNASESRFLPVRSSPDALVVVRRLGLKLWTAESVVARLCNWNFVNHPRISLAAKQCTAGRLASDAPQCYPKRM
jgi:hypothetical protein